MMACGGQGIDVVPRDNARRQLCHGASSSIGPRLTPARSSINEPEVPYFPVLILQSKVRRYRLVVSVGFHPRPPVRRLEHDAGRWAVLLTAGPAPASPTRTTPPNWGPRTRALPFW